MVDVFAGQTVSLACKTETSLAKSIFSIYTAKMLSVGLKAPNMNQAPRPTIKCP
jgi:hypothetical protein